MEKHPLTQWLERASPVVFSSYAVLAAFSTYFCMYAFRKPFAAGTFEGTADLDFLPEMDLKILYVVAQVIGYCLSKFIGIKVISELSPAKRAVAILVVIGIAEAALFLFAITPAPWAALCLLLNGLPLGMVWGLVFGFLEGRKLSELLGAGLSASYIVASGVVKSVGRYLVVDQGMSEYWMPATVGLIFTIPLCICVWLLSKLPPPNAEDEALRTRREPMDGAARTHFVKSFFPGLFFLTALYIFLTAYRAVRDDFAVDIWIGLGFANKPSILATSEMWVGFGVLLVLALFVGIKNNRRALTAIHGVMLAGSIMVGVLTYLFETQAIGPKTWMIGIGLGLYLAYVPYGCMLFDRMIAALGVVATAGFMIYVTDAFGYVGNIGVLLYKNFFHRDMAFVEFFVSFSYWTSGICTVCFALSWVYFESKAKAIVTAKR
ncbi:MAG: DUF5690 family protein [Myxococcota bacterium]|nr:DUF5690 family protein [Myxococcota bacterium]